MHFHAFAFSSEWVSDDGGRGRGVVVYVASHDHPLEQGAHVESMVDVNAQYLAVCNSTLFIDSLCVGFLPPLFLSLVPEWTLKLLQNRAVSRGRITFPTAWITLVSPPPPLPTTTPYWEAAGSHT